MCSCSRTKRPFAAFRAEAWIKAGETLRKAERFKFALEQLERGLEIDPENLKGLREQGICLQRLALASVPGHSIDRARQHYKRVLDDFPKDPETWALLGRVDKDAWIASVAYSRQDAGRDARRSGGRGCAPARHHRELRKRIST
jgi:tetratricopeptide (TPR) repeat protein